MISAAAPSSKDAVKGNIWKKTKIKEGTNSTTQGISQRGLKKGRKFRFRVRSKMVGIRLK